MQRKKAKEGYGEYRTHLGTHYLLGVADSGLMDQVRDTYNWNHGALKKFNEVIKDAIDPNGILMAGKSGVWPKRYRRETQVNGDAK